VIPNKEVGKKAGVENQHSGEKVFQSCLASMPATFTATRPPQQRGALSSYLYLRGAPEKDKTFLNRGIALFAHVVREQHRNVAVPIETLFEQVVPGGVWAEVA